MKQKKRGSRLLTTVPLSPGLKRKLYLIVFHILLTAVTRVLFQQVISTDQTVMDRETIQVRIVRRLMIPPVFRHIGIPTDQVRMLDEWQLEFLAEGRRRTGSGSTPSSK